MQEIDGDCGVPAMVATAQTFGNLIHWHPHVRLCPKTWAALIEAVYEVDPLTTK